MKVALVLPLLLVLGGCGSEEDFVPKRSNGDTDHEDPDESCVPGDGGPRACTGNNICIAGTCEGAFGRVYRITVLNITVPNRNADGECWDAPGCGAPDPFVAVFLNDVNILQTDVAQDTFSATFNKHADVVIPAGSSFEIAMWDADISAHDLIGYCRIETLSASWLRTGALSCSNGTHGVNYSIVPR